jgi:hypothetical protein
MAITGNYKPEDWNRVREQIHERVIAAMVYAGEQFITDSRSQPGDHALGFYEDRTGNLRNSIGYYVFYNGLQVASNDPMGNANLVMPYVSSGYQLIGLAGMDYATYVEAKGYNVISIQADVCIVNLDMYMKDIQHFADR